MFGDHGSVLHPGEMAQQCEPIASKEGLAEAKLSYPLVITIGAAPPVALLALFFQASPASHHVLSLVVSAPEVFGLHAYVAVLILCLCFLLVVWAAAHSSRRPIPWAAWWLGLSLIVFAATLSVPHFPCWSLGVLNLVGFALLWAIRVVLYADVDAKPWFRSVWISAALAASLCLLAWAAWIAIGFEGRQGWTGWTPPFRKMVSEHEITWKAAYVCWTFPLFTAMELCVVGLLCWIRERECQSPEGVVAALKQLSVWLVAAALVLWLNAGIHATGDTELNTTREDMRDEVTGLAILTFGALFLWTLDTIGPDEVKLAVAESRVVQETVSCMDNDWPKAALLLGAAIPMALCACLDSMRSTLHRSGKERDEDKTNRSLLWFTASWSWTSVMVKALWIGVLYIFLAVGIAKAFTVFLAMLNERLRSWPLFQVSALLFVVCWALFMNPASPALPVYVVMGIIMVSNALRQGWTFTGAVVWATFVTYAMKMAFTAAAQKWIGENLSSNKTVLRLVGFHTPYTRALVEVLKTPELTLAKVALLIGGPDWPVAVLCGMVHLPVPHVLLGTSPVLVQQVFPCVLAGGLFVVESDKSSDGLGEVCLAVAALLQLVAGVLAFFYVQEILERDFAELSQIMPEHAELQEEQDREDAMDRAYWREVTFRDLPGSMKLALCLGLAFMELSLLVLLGPWEQFGLPCFKDFGLTSSFDQELDGSFWTIVEPLGWFGLAVHAAAVVCLGTFYSWSHLHVSPAKETEGKALL